MSTKNQISIEIPQGIIDEVTSHLQKSKTLLAPYLQALTLQDRHELFKLGDKTVATVSKVKSYLETNPEFAPAYMDKAEFLKDEVVLEQLNPIANLLTQLSSDTEDTLMLAGNEALLASMLYYGTVKEASAKGVPAAKPIYEDLKARFTRKSKPKTTPTTTP